MAKSKRSMTRGGKLSGLTVAATDLPPVVASAPPPAQGQRFALSYVWGNLWHNGWRGRLTLSGYLLSIATLFDTWTSSVRRLGGTEFLGFWHFQSQGGLIQGDNAFAAGKWFYVILLVGSLLCYARRRDILSPGFRVAPIACAVLLTILVGADVANVPRVLPPDSVGIQVDPSGPTFFIIGQILVGIGAYLLLSRNKLSAAGRL